MTRLCAILALAVLLAISNNGAAMADQDLTFRSWCIGRHLVDVPEGFEPLENYGTINAMRVEDLGAGDARGLARLADDRARALAAGQVADDGVPLIFRGRYDEGDIRVLAHELDIGQAPGTSFTWTEEAHVLRGGRMMRVVQVLSEDEEVGPRAQLLELARRILPGSRAVPPEGPGACLPDALAQVRPGTEVHGMTFVPGDAEGAPVGLEISIVSRSAEDPPLDPDMPRGATARPITIAGIEGLMVDDPQRFGPSRLAVAVREASATAPALRIQVYYYDERPDPGSPPYSEAMAEAVWTRAIASFRARSGSE